MPKNDPIVSLTRAFNSTNNTFTVRVVSDNTDTPAPAITYSIPTAQQGVATITEAGKVTIKTVGEVTITATQAESANYNEATATLTLTISKGTQTITFDALSTKTVGDAPFTLSATSSSGLAISYSSSNTSVAMISGNTVTLVGAGETTITASQAGDDEYVAATDVTQTLIVHQSLYPLTSSDVTMEGGTITGYINNTQTNIKIPEAIDGVTVTAIGGGAFANKNLTGIHLPNSVATISASAFEINKLTSINIPNNVTIIGMGAFANNRFTNVLIEADSRLRTIGGSAFTNSDGSDISYTLPTSAYANASHWVKRVANLIGNLTRYDIGDKISNRDDVGVVSYTLQATDDASLKLSQQITFDALSTKTVGDAPFTLSATSSSGLAISYSSSNTSVATISGNTVTLVEAGETTITASQAGNDEYVAATDVTQTLIVHQSLYPLTSSDVTMEGGTITGYINNTQTNIKIPETIDGVTVTAIGGGAFADKNLTGIHFPNSVSIINQWAFKGNQLTSVSIPNTVTIIGMGAFANNRFTKVSIEADSRLRSIGGNAFTNSDGSDIYYTLPTSAYANALHWVKMTSFSNITYNIGDRFSHRSDAEAETYLLKATDDASLKLSQQITFDALSTKTVGDAPFTLSATSSSGLAISYSSSNTSVATISGNTVTLVEAGETTITASQAGNDKYVAATDVTQTLIVHQSLYPLTSSDVTMEGGTITGYINNTQTNIKIPETIDGVTVTAIGRRAFADKNLTGIHLPNSVATISASAFESNKLTSINIPNNVTIIGMGAFINNRFTKVSIEADSRLRSIGGNAFTNSDGSDISYTLPTSAYANASYWEERVGHNFLPVRHNIGDKISHISNVEMALYSLKTADGTSSLKLSQQITFDALSTKTLGDASFTLSATSSSGLAISYSSSNTSVATISGNTVTLVEAGETTITASQAGNDEYVAATDVTQTLIVNATSKKSQTITFDALVTKTVGDASFTLSATSSSGLAISYSSSNTSVAMISGNTVTLVGAGETTITASQAGDDEYVAAADVTQTLIVAKGTQTLRFEGNNPLSKPLGVENTFSVRATREHADATDLAITYSIPVVQQAIATITEAGEVTIKMVGTVTITATQLESDNYNGATATLTLNVIEVHNLEDEEIVVSEDGVITNLNLHSENADEKALNIPETVGNKTVTRIGANAFKDKDLVHVTLPKTVTTIEAGAFEGNKLETINIPISVTTIGANAFEGNKLETINIPTNVTTIGDGAFKNNGLTEIIFVAPTGRHVATQESSLSISASAFEGNKLTTLTIPAYIQHIGERAFASNQLVSVTIVATKSQLKTIGASAFAENPANLTAITLPAVEGYQWQNSDDTKVTTITEFTKSYTRVTEDVTPPLAIADQQVLRVYPNPVKATLFVEVPLETQSLGYEINIIDFAGRSYSAETIWQGSKLQVDVSNLSDGIYIIVLKSSEGKEMMRFIKH